VGNFGGVVAVSALRHQSVALGMFDPQKALAGD
jgi:hypothetical protein